MRVLVTGATGFVGGHVADRLLARGDAVTLLVRSAARARRFAERGATLVEGDLADRAALHRAVQGQDAVLHIAALVASRDEAALTRANAEGTAALAAATREASPGARFVLVSSLAAAGPARRGAPLTAGRETGPVTMYGRSKLASEAALRATDVAWTILRPPAVYGPRDRDNFLAAFRLVRTGFGVTFGDGSLELSLVHVEDLADAIVRAGDAAPAGTTFFVNHPEVVTNAQVLRAIAGTLGTRVRLVGLPEGVTRPLLTGIGALSTLVGAKSILHPDKANEFYQAAWTADPSPFMAATGWTPRYDHVAGLAQTYRWYREAGWL